jgi:ATP-dependent helicase HrpB
MVFLAHLMTNRLDAMGFLPITEILDDLKDVLHRNHNAVLQAPPGAGKTTGVPLALLDASWLQGRRIIMLEPRRLAVRAAAYRMADLLDEPVGRTIGYRVRMDSRVGPEGRIEVVTEGVLVRMLQADPALSDVGLVIFDEYHERSLEADLALALCRDIQGVLNNDLRLLVMSATLEAEPVAELLDKAPVLTCRGRSFPVETRYRGLRPGEKVAAAVTATVLQAVAEGHGSILVFLPGAAEIRHAVKGLEAAALGPEWRIAPLYGNLSREMQQQAIAPSPAGEHKIVLATSIAETSLTIEGIRVVVDSGLSRVPRFDVGSGLTRLVTVSATRASVDQRRGRAGRTAPGTCFRLWSREQHAGLVTQARPAILEADLTPLVLELALWGVTDATTLDWLDPPSPAALQQGGKLLADLGAIDRSGHITDHGRAMVTLPLHPRLAHMVLMAVSIGAGDLACDLAALLSERDILRLGPGERDADLRPRLEILAQFHRARRFDTDLGRVDPEACQRVRRVADNLRHRLAIERKSYDDTMAGSLLAWAYPDRIAQARGGQRGRFLLSGGRGALLDPAEPLAAADYLVAATLDGDRREARIFLGAALTAADLHDRCGPQMQWVDRVDWDAERQVVRAERLLKLGALCLKTETLTVIDAETREVAFLKGIRSTGLSCLPWTKALRNWQARVLFLRRLGDPEAWPDVSDAGLVETLENWLRPYLRGFSGLKDIRRMDLSAALHGHLPWRQQQRLDRLAPTHLVVPSGSRRPIDYRGEIPVLAVRLQEMFGARETPTIAEGRQALSIHLLSPAGRPAQITQDLAGFWKNSYPEVKKELKGRYPKHHWPEDPLQARPTARVRPR